MELIFYPEAAKITGTTIGSVYQAVSRGDLTRAGKRGRNLCLIKEQVELFRSRPMIKKTLSSSDRAKWDRYALEASQGQKQAPDSALVNETIARQLQPIKDEVKTEVRNDVILGLMDALKGMLSSPKTSVPA